MKNRDAEPVSRRAVSAILALALALLLSACGDDPVTPPVDDTPTSTPPVDIEQLMQAFVKGYDTMDAPLAISLLAPDFETILQQRTTDAYPAVGTTLDRTEQDRILERMMSGGPLTDPDGNFVPGITAIDFALFEQLSPWVPAEAGDPFEEGVKSLHNVIVIIDRGQTFARLKIQGALEFFAADYDTTIGGRTYNCWWLRGVKDLTSDQKPSETTSWGDVHALFR